METTYSLKQLIEILGKNKFALLLRIILSRVPVLIFSNDSEADNLLNGLIALSPHHLPQIFANDFFEPEEYLQLCEDEESNFESPRILFCAPSDSTKYIFGRIPSLKGWLLAFSEENGTFREEMIERIKSIEEKFLDIVIEPDKLNLTLHGIKNSNFNLAWEKKVISEIYQKTEVSISKIKRVLLKKVKIPKSNEIMTAIMRFDSEESKIRINIFNSLLSSFQQAGMRALAILSRIDLLRELGYQVELSSKLLLQTIDYELADAERILELIEAEYGVSFHKVIRGGKAAQILDRIDSSWG